MDYFFRDFCRAYFSSERLFHIRLDLAKEMGATGTINFKELKTIEERVAKVKELTGGYCEMGFFVNAGECTMNPHFDLCNKEITLVGSWVYSAQEYIETLGFIKKAKEMSIPIKKQ